MIEVWKDIYFVENNITYDYRNYYQISNYGNVKSLKHKKPKIKSPVKQSDGYYQISLHKKGNKKKFLIHRLVAIHFLPNPHKKHYVNHINGIKIDNRASELEWTTERENVQHANKIGLNPRIKKVLQYDLEENFIKEWDSISSAEKELKICRGKILLVCKGKRKKTGGFIWRYKEDIKN